MSAFVTYIVQCRCLLTKEFQSYHWPRNILPCSDVNTLPQGLIKGVSIQKNGIMQVSCIDVSLEEKAAHS